MYQRMQEERERYKIFDRGGSRDYWAYSICAGCYGHCSVRIRVVDGVPVFLETVPDSDLGGHGGICGKGGATILDYCDPNRVNYPLKRTGKKGIGEDPKFVRISWEEALDEITQKMKEARETNPMKVVWSFTPGHGTGLKATQSQGGFMTCYGSPNMALGGPGCQCGAVAHHLGALVHASWDILPDYRYNNFLLRCGGNEGMGGGRIAMTSARQFAQARERGQTTWCMDPVGYVASAAKSKEWIPILPGTDGAVFLAIVNIIIHEIGKYDEVFIRHKTNAPYLIYPETGRFVRDEDGYNLMYDENDQTIKTYPDKTLTEPAIEGEFTYNDKKVKPCFEAIKEHVKEWTPERASNESTVPAKKIREIAYKLIDEAKIGSTINIDGVEVPYRPAGLCAYKGSQAHQNGFHQHACMYLINSLLGNQDVAGGIVGEGTVRSLGHPETGKPRFAPYGTTDGMVTPAVWHTRTPWPPRDVNMEGPKFVSLLDILADATFSPYPYCEDWDKIWTNAGRPYEPEIFYGYGGNVIRNLGNREIAANFLHKMKFVWYITTTINDTVEAFADIVLPECHNYESLELWSSVGFFFSYPIGMDDWTWHVRMPVVPPKYERRDGMDIHLDLAERMGFRDLYNEWIDTYFAIRESTWEQEGAEDIGSRTHSKRKKWPIVAPDERVSWMEICNRVLKHHMNRDLNWFMENGFRTWKKKPEECYWRYHVKCRVPVYYEHHLHTKPNLEKKCQELDMPLDMRHWTALPSHFRPLMYDPAPGEPEDWRDSEYDLITITHRDSLHAHATSSQNPWIDEMSKNNPYTYNWMLHHDYAKKKGIQDGDWIVVENHAGDRVPGRVKLTWLLHYNVVSAVGLGTWAKDRPIGRDKGIRYNEVLRGNAKNFCSLTGSFEDSARVRVYKVEGKELERVLDEEGYGKLKEELFS